MLVLAQRDQRVWLGTARVQILPFKWQVAIFSGKSDSGTMRRQGTLEWTSSGGQKWGSFTRKVIIL